LIKKLDGNRIELTQTGLIKRILEAMGFEGANPKATPAETEALPADKLGIVLEPSFNYVSVIGMLQDLQGYIRLDISFAVSQFSRYIHCHTNMHIMALKRIGRYLLKTLEKGIILKPTSDLTIDWYVDADFAGLCNQEDHNDDNCVKSRTGYVLCISSCPVLWITWLQDGIALSTMESEYVALSMAMRDLLPFKILVQSIFTGGVGLKKNQEYNILCIVFEDNAGALALANLELPRTTPRFKHYAVKYHWFRACLRPENIRVLKVESERQMADIFTKGLPKSTVENIREL